MQQVDESVLDELSEEDAEEAEAPPGQRNDHDIEVAYDELSFRVIYQANNFFLPQIRDLIKGNEVINLRPEYQRRLRWSPKKKSLLIESLLLNIPIPPIFLYESDLARYEVMDGQQRLNAIHEFLENNYNLTGLEQLVFLNGRRFNKLPPKLRRSLDRASISAIILLRETRSSEADPYLIRRSVFERLNTGGEKLNPQEIRNSINRGPFNNLIVRLARNNTFCRIFGIPEYTTTDESELYENPQRQRNRLYRRMNDCQIVLRFFALLEGEFIRGSMRSILDDCMERNKDSSEEQLNEYEKAFENLIDANYQIFDGRPFLLPPDDKGQQRVSAPLYDACMVALYGRLDSLHEFIGKRAQIQKGVNEVLERDLGLFTAKANTAQSIKDRIAEIGRILDGLS